MSLPAPRAPRRPAAPTPEDWFDALLTSGSEALLGAVRNYVGPVKTPYDKRELAGRLEAFLRRPEARESALNLLDGLDARILGTCLAIGPATEPEIKELFLGELPLFELGLRIANLLDRLLLFRYVEGSRRLVAVNPLLAGELRSRVADPGLVFGVQGTPGVQCTPGALADAGGGAAEELVGDAAAAVALFSFLFHSPSALRKGGGLTKRAAERAAALFRGLAPASAPEGRLDSMAKALACVGALRPEGELWVADRAAFAAIVEDWGEALPFLLAAALAASRAPEAEAEEEGGRPAQGRLALAGLLARAFAAAPPGLAFSRPSLARWLKVEARAEGRSDALGDPALAVAALEELGLLAPAPGGDGLRLAVAGKPAEGRRGAAAAGRPSPALVAEGDHALHLMPEAGLEERLLAGCLARPKSLGKVWSFELDRETARAAFASGIGASSARERLEALAGMPLPQSLAFSLAAWEEEYRSLRLYRGLVLVADERQRPLVELGIASGALLAESLAPGVYFLSASGPEEAAAQLARAGLEAPPAVLRAAAPGRGGDEGRPAAGAAEAGFGPGSPFAPADAIGEIPAEPAAPRRPLDPEPRLAQLRAALEASGRSGEEAKELRDRIERRLVLTADQIALSDPRTERLEAGSLDYPGKVRVVERSLRGQGDRLEVRYRLPGGEPAHALLRPVRLDKTDKGLVLEAEDLGTGGPVRVSLGAVSMVRRVRASLFGEES